MADQIRTKCGLKLQKKRYMSKLDYITIYIKRSYRLCIQSALTIKGYLEQLFDGVSFRDQFGKSVLRFMVTKVYREQEF